MDDSLSAAFELVKEAMGVGGSWYAATIAAVVVAIRLIRTSTIQALLPRRLQWEAAPQWARLFAVLASSGLASLVTSLIAGKELASALVAAIGVAIAAVPAHKVTQAAGHAQTRARLKLHGAAYHPSSLRTAISPVLPIDHDAIEITQRYARQTEAARRRENEKMAL